MRNRLLLIGLTVLTWVSLRVIDFVLPWPAICVLLSITLFIMIAHSAWLLMAQRRERKQIALAVNLPEIIAGPLWEPSVDILIPAKNEARVIEKTVRNFFKLDYPCYSVTVIDDASDDDMPEVLLRLQNEFSNLKVLRRAKGSVPGKSAGLNDALPGCSAEVIAVFDADAFVEPDFLRKVLPNLQPENVGAVQAQKKIFLHQSGFLPSCQASEYALDTYFQVGRDLIGGAVELRGNGELMKRAALIDVGGWNNKAITDDLDLTMRLLLAKWDVKFSPETIVWEEAVTTLKGLIRQRRRWAEGSIRRYLDYIFPLNSPSRLSMVQRLDILAFLSEFAIPGLMLLEFISEVISFASGGVTHPKFMLIVAGMVFLISIVNFFIAMRFYRTELTIGEALVHCFEVNFYVYAHWIPCVLVSFLNVAFRQQASKWHRTEHLGSSTS
ncbi:MAG: glycosyltransferase family 2 protein [Candidatus Obscuribacterales bacterium]|nr:glycosyltransferase family 2 protein [Candidatus Obscuribacterales bacterium]